MKSLPDIFTIFLEIKTSKWIIGFSRSLFATGLLLTLMFNDLNLLIPDSYLNSLNLHSLKFRFNFFLIFNSSHIVLMQVLAILILTFVISGYLLKVTSLLHFWISASFYLLNPIKVGGDNINMMITLLLIPVCWFDARKNHWDAPVESNKFNHLIQNLFLFTIKLQVAFIYLDSVFDKLHVKEWLNGRMIYYWFNHHFFGLHPKLLGFADPLLKSMPVLLFISWSTMLLEAVLVTALIFPERFKLLLLKVGIIFHLSIMLIHGFASFFFAMSAALFLYLYPSEKSFSLKYYS